MGCPGTKAMAGLILAGGRSRRMGTEKGLLPLAGVPLIGRIASRLRSQVDCVAISANGDPRRFDAFGLPVIADPVVDRGPLGGVLAGLRWASSRAVPKLLTVACDTPFFPLDLAARLAEATKDHPGRIAVASSGDRPHFTIALYPTDLADDLEEWLARQNDYSIRTWLGRHNLEAVRFEEEAGFFFNINTPGDRLIAETQFARSG